MALGVRRSDGIPRRVRGVTLVIGLATTLAACTPVGGSSHPSTSTSYSKTEGLSDAQLTAQLEAIPGVTSAKLATQDGLDVGQSKYVDLVVASADRAAAGCWPRVDAVVAAPPVARRR